MAHPRILAHTHTHTHARTQALPFTHSHTHTNTQTHTHTYSLTHPFTDMTLLTPQQIHAAGAAAYLD